MREPLQRLASPHSLVIAVSRSVSACPRTPLLLQRTPHVRVVLPHVAFDGPHMVVSVKPAGAYLPGVLARRGQGAGVRSVGFILGNMLSCGGDCKRLQ